MAGFGWGGWCSWSLLALRKVRRDPASSRVLPRSVCIAFWENPEASSSSGPISSSMASMLIFSPLNLNHYIEGEKNQQSSCFSAVLGLQKN